MIEGAMQDHHNDSPEGPRSSQEPFVSDVAGSQELRGIDELESPVDEPCDSEAVGSDSPTRKVRRKRRRRSETLQVRCFPDEFDFLEDLAEEEETSLANLCRAILFVA